MSSFYSFRCLPSIIPPPPPPSPCHPAADAKAPGGRRDIKPDGAQAPRGLCAHATLAGPGGSGRASGFVCERRGAEVDPHRCPCLWPSCLSLQIKPNCQLHKLDASKGNLISNLSSCKINAAHLTRSHLPVASAIQNVTENWIISKSGQIGRASCRERVSSPV